MLSLFLYHLAYLKRVWWLAAFVTSACIYLAVTGQIRALAALAGTLLFAGLYYYGWSTHLWDIVQQTRRFKLLAGKRVVLRYAPEMDKQLDLAAQLHCWERSLQELEERFGFSLKRRVEVFVFPSTAVLSQLFRRELGAAALVEGHAVVVAADQLLDERDVDETMRHELAHLFSAYWGEVDPPFKGEGLATYLQATWQGKALDSQALAVLIGRTGYPLAWLLPDAAFYSDGANYAVAGSFTGFLVRQFGWDAYAGFFRDARSKNFQTAFRQAFGSTLFQVECQWRGELLARRQEFEPELTRAVREERMAGAYRAGQIFACLEAYEAIIQAAPPALPLSGWQLALTQYLETGTVPLSFSRVPWRWTIPGS